MTLFWENAGNSVNIEDMINMKSNAGVMNLSMEENSRELLTDMNRFDIFTFVGLNFDTSQIANPRHIRISLVTFLRIFHSKQIVFIGSRAKEMCVRYVMVQNFD